MRGSATSASGSASSSDAAGAECELEGVMMTKAGMRSAFSSSQKIGHGIHAR